MRYQQQPSRFTTNERCVLILSALFGIPAFYAVADGTTPAWALALVVAFCAAMAGTAFGHANERP